MDPAVELAPNASSGADALRSAVVSLQAERGAELWGHRTDFPVEVPTGIGAMPPCNGESFPSVLSVSTDQPAAP